MSPHGLVVPVAVVNRKYAGAELMVEDVFHYSPFRMFETDTQIKFEEEPAPPAAPVAPKKAPK